MQEDVQYIKLTVLPCQSNMAAMKRIGVVITIINCEKLEFYNTV